MESWKRVRHALAGKGFTLLSGSGRDHYEGSLRVGSIDVDLEIEIADYEFLNLPSIWVKFNEALPIRLMTHIMSNDQLCYADRATLLLDRYQPDRSVLTCLEEAKKTLTTLIHGNPTAEFMAEFTAYWSTTPYCLIDDPYSLETAALGVCEFENGPQVLIAGSSKKRLDQWARRAAGRFKALFEAPVVRAVEAIRPPAHSRLFLKDVLNWLQPQVSCEQALLDLVTHKDDEIPSLLVVASNAIIGLRAKKTGLIKKSDEGGFRRSAIPGLWKKEAGKVPIETFHCIPTSQEEITARSLDQEAPLKGKRIALLGSGTIGGYLARALVQLGAGHNGDILLIDEDILKPENLGRHILGARHLWSNKANALSAQLRCDFPDAQILALSASAQSAFDRIVGYDLVIDATGDEQFSDALNAFALERASRDQGFPPVLFAMIFGNGLAAQTYLSQWRSETACFRCLKPRFDQDWRHSPIKANAKGFTTAVRPCAIGAFVPFAVFASLQAAALAAKHAGDTFDEGYNGDLRTVQIDMTKTIAIPPRGVSPSPHCPACATLAL